MVSPRLGFVFESQFNLKMKFICINVRKNFIYAKIEISNEKDYFSDKLKFIIKRLN